MEERMKELKVGVLADVSPRLTMDSIIMLFVMR